MFSNIQKFDERVSLFLFSNRLPLALHQTMRWYTRLGDGYVWALVLVYLFFSIPEISIWWIVKQSFLAGGISLALYQLLKLTIRRPRPFAKLKQISAEVPPLDEFSFPSGHTMNNLAAGFTLLLLVPHVGWIVVLMPLTWGALRVYFGVHWFSDIIAGVFLGFASFLIAHLVWLHFFSHAA